MKRKKLALRLPSPAMVVATAALFVAIGGTSYAAFSLRANTVGTKQLKNGAITTGKLKNGAVTKAKLNVAGLTVPGALHASSADTAQNATDAVSANHASTADNATNAASAATASDANALGGFPGSSFAPVIYAHVLADGTVDASESKGITASMVHLRLTSAYCFSGLPFTPKGGSATIDYGRAANKSNELAELQIEQADHAIDCQPNEQVEVSTASPPGLFNPEPFFVVLYG